MRVFKGKRLVLRMERWVFNTIHEGVYNHQFDVKHPILDVFLPKIGQICLFLVEFDESGSF